MEESAAHEKAEMSEMKKIEKKLDKKMDSKKSEKRMGGRK